MNLPPRKLATSSLGAEIRAARHRRKLTQKALATLAKIDLATLRNLESGRGTVTSLVSVLSALQHSFSEQPTELPLGCWLKSHRKFLKFSQQTLCETSGISKPSVIQIERGQGNIATLTAIMTSAGLSVTLRPNEGSVPSGSVWRNGVLRRLRREFTVGDCIEVMPSFEAGSIDLIVTSPPYNRDKVYGSSRDDLSLTEYRAFAQAWLAKAVPLLSEKGSLWINLGNTKDPEGGTLPLEHLYLPLLKNFGLILVQAVIWDHCTAKPQVTKFTQVHERWLWCARRAKGYTWNLNPVRVPPKTSLKRGVGP